VDRQKSPVQNQDFAIDDGRYVEERTSEIRVLATLTAGSRVVKQRTDEHSVTKTHVLRELALSRTRTYTRGLSPALRA